MSGCITRWTRCRIPRPGISPKGKSDPGFRTKLAIGADLAVQAREAGFVFRAVAADSAYGDQDGFRGELAEAGLPFVMALKPRHGTWAYGADACTPVDAPAPWPGPGRVIRATGRPVTRTFRDGRTEAWWAADATLGWWGPDGFTRLVVATADPGTLPGKATWYLATNLPRPGGPREAEAFTRRRAWPRSCGSTGSGTGSSRVTSTSKTSWAGPISRSAPI